jgi:hypothetical protein
MMLIFDHIAVSAMTLEEGVAAVEQALGLPLAGGGQHPHMSTHNRLMGVGDVFLEVIAIDPNAPKPDWPRWFDLDNFTGPPRLTNWVACTTDLTAAVAAAPQGIGVPVALSRGNYRWQMAVPADGKLPFDGAYPALIQWDPPHHPTQALPEQHIRLTRLEIAHPEAEALRAAVSGLTDGRIHIIQGPAKAMRATFDTPHGTRTLE